MTKRILLVDDEEIIIRSLLRLLKKNGFEVFVAKSGQDALVMAEEEKFDLMIVDVRMPGINGIETVESINKEKMKHKLKEIPTIFITGYADKDIEEKAETLNPLAYIYKPFDISELIDKVKEVLS